MSKFITRLGVLAAASASILTVAPMAQAAPLTDGSKPTIPTTQGANRISGEDRYEVSVNAAKVAINDKKADGTTFVIASGEVWPDAVSVAPLAGCSGAPVLLVTKNNLPYTVQQFLKQSDAKTPIKRIIISGGEGTVSPAVVDQLRKQFGEDILIERNGGENRQQVAYNNAAEASECYLGTTTIKDAQAQLQKDTRAEQAYQDALAAYNTAYKNDAAAKAVYDAAKAKVDALVAQLNKQADSLVSVPAASQAAYDAAVAARQTAADQLAKDLAAATVINGLATTNMTTTDLNSTMADYLAKAGSNADTLQAAMTQLGIQSTDTLKAAIGKANTRVADDRAAVDAKTSDVATTALALQKAAAATAANKVVADQMAITQAQLDAAKKALADAAKALNTADAKLAAAKDALATATNARPAPGVIADDVKALDAARTNAVKAAGKNGQVSAFLATGRIYTDALSTGPAAVKNTGVVLLTGDATGAGNTLGKWATKWKTDFSAAGQTVNGQYIPVGGDAIKAAGSDAVYKIAGSDRYEVSVNLAKKYFSNQSTMVAVYPVVASGEIYSDATVAGTFGALYGNPLLLTRGTVLPVQVDNYLRNSIEKTAGNAAATVVGGPGTVNAATFSQVQAAISAK